MTSDCVPWYDTKPYAKHSTIQNMTPKKHFSYHFTSKLSLGKFRYRYQFMHVFLWTSVLQQHLIVLSLSHDKRTGPLMCLYHETIHSELLQDAVFRGMTKTSVIKMFRAITWDELYVCYETKSYAFSTNVFRAAKSHMLSCARESRSVGLPWNLSKYEKWTIASGE